MKTPGFTAEASLYGTGSQYARSRAQVRIEGTIQPADFLDQGCYTQCINACAGDCDGLPISERAQCRQECQRDCRAACTRPGAPPPPSGGGGGGSSGGLCEIEYQTHPFGHEITRAAITELRNNNVISSKADCYNLATLAGSLVGWAISTAPGPWFKPLGILGGFNTATLTRCVCDEFSW